ncbi:MAG: GNAT family N-acetyltransferase [Sulfitobacter sp.]
MNDSTSLNQAKPIFVPARENPNDVDVRALIERHFDLMRSLSPAESCHVMEPETLVQAGACLFGLRKEGVLLGIGAVTPLDSQTAELKSMHTTAEARGQGVARLLLRTLLDAARAMGASRVNLETGTDPAFAAARGLYISEGFAECPPFSGYRIDPLSVYMTKSI